MTMIGLHFHFRRTKKETRDNPTAAISTPPTDSTAGVNHPLWIMEYAAEPIKPTTTGRKPFNALVTSLKPRYFRYSQARTETIRQDGRIQPSVATSAPETPAIRAPTKLAELTAIGPGVISDMVINFGKFVCGQPMVNRNNLFFYQRSAASPPPTEKHPIRKDKNKSSSMVLFIPPPI